MRFHIKESLIAFLCFIWLFLYIPLLWIKSFRLLFLTQCFIITDYLLTVCLKFLDRNQKQTLPLYNLFFIIGDILRMFLFSTWNFTQIQCLVILLCLLYYFYFLIVFILAWLLLRIIIICIDICLNINLCLYCCYLISKIDDTRHPDSNLFSYL